MEGTIRDPLADLERHRLQLEGTVAKLCKSLRHWQTWEFEYEALKEEIQRFKGQPSTEDMVKIGRDFGGDLVNEKEIKELIGYRKPVQRNGPQVVDMISRRLDYVQQNSHTVQKQLDGAQNKLQAALVLLEPDLDDGQGLPLTDIHEELDEQGNVISSTLLHPSKAAPSVINTLRKAGAIEAEDNLNSNSSVEPDAANPDSSRISEASVSHRSIKEDTRTDKASLDGNAGSSKPILSAVQRKQSPTKKSVAFAQDPVIHASSPEGLPITVSSRLEDSLDAFNFNRGEKVIELDEDEREVASYPIIPVTEPPEDAALRKEMLQYGLAEVNAVVAEIDLEEGDELSDLDDDYDGEYPETDDDEEEDEYGRTTQRVITEEYRKQMLELEKKLNARMIENVGPQAEDVTAPGSVKDVRRLVVQRGEFEEIAATEPGATKKGVRFAGALDVSPAPAKEVDHTQHITQSPTGKAPLADAIIERKQASTKGTSRLLIEPPKPTKVSRFKSARIGADVVAPADTKTADVRSEANNVLDGREEVPGPTIANQVVEREVVEDEVIPPDDDALDPALLAQEVVVEYNKKRNRIIQNRGGFMPSTEEIESPLMEEKDGKVEKVSRFKAARLKSVGI